MESLPPSTDNRKQTKNFRWQPRYERILRALFTYRGLTAEQITRLFYSSGSLTFVQTDLLALTQQKYIARFFYPTPSPATSPYVNTLGSRGKTYLTALGVDLAGYKPLKEKGKETSYYFTQHLLSINDFLIAASLVGRISPDVSLQAMIHEWQLKQQPLSSTIGRDTLSVVPDAWLDFKVLAGSQKKPYQMPVWLEMDMGTEWGKRFKDKLRSIVLLVVNGVYQARFGVSNVTVAFATPENEKRRDLMRAHIKIVLEELDALRFADLFLFACLPQHYDPQTVFLSPIWYTPTSEKPLPLLDLSD